MPTDMYGQPPGNGGSFAQKQQMRANPIMQGRPGMSGPRPTQLPMTPQGQGQQPNPFSGGRPMMNQMNANAGMQGSRAMLQQKLKNAQSQGLGPTQLPATGQAVQSGLAPLQTPYDQQQNPVQPVPQLSPMNYPEPEVDMGSQDPRELARMGLGPSPGLMNSNVVMDENGLEPRRGAR